MLSEAPVAFIVLVKWDGAKTKLHVIQFKNNHMLPNDISEKRLPAQRTVVF